MQYYRKQCYKQDFAYNGRGPDAYFWVNEGPRATRDGTIVPHPGGELPASPLEEFSGSNEVVLTLPNDMKTSQVGNLSVWCKRFSINFGDIVIPSRRPANDE